MEQPSTPSAIPSTGAITRIQQNETLDRAIPRIQRSGTPVRAIPSILRNERLSEATCHTGDRLAPCLVLDGAIPRIQGIGRLIEAIPSILRNETQHSPPIRQSIPTGRLLNSNTKRNTMNTFTCTGLAFDWNDDEPEQTVAHMIELMLAHGDVKPTNLSLSNLMFDLGEEVECCIIENAIKRAFRLLADKGVIKDSGGKAESYVTGEFETIWEMGASNAKIKVINNNASH